MKSFRHLSALVPLLGALMLFASGCGGGKTTEKQAENKGDTSKQVAKKKHDDHSGWWCPEHGIPEEICSMCSIDYAEKCKKKGDWCEKHDRAKSQCFICNPKLKEKFAAQYRAKYGKEPPPIDEDLNK